ncbi:MULTISPECIES: imidazole glycerol phosphate synthase subunit HisF [unclassified Arthrobacter]|uniref:imidazole glycerol phosphate synthase subunit HisF n=1 Tax=unclassified Arthrobacter TaxID=235627 RepID=UPI00149094DE|nr:MULTISPECIES: imidazole glycerol phosphate synthase subunit HisF [unclassified Arthrobacter]MBE0010951.1 imidazole glycerol phosphate synthase subunit HisF [Arthrobacter sp. AET 35A]NOJ64457.1 imidazole glycerol phosphate synthase subunit HisF [Arthrobacter sp. 147(2020)]
MGVAIRVIPCLDVDAGRVVKGVNFADLRDAGDPVELAHRYDRAGADELTFLDVTASSGNRDTTFDVVARTAEEVFIPLTVGGGVRGIADVDKLLRFGADKASINTAAVSRPEVIDEITSHFGSQVLVLSLDARRVPGGGTPSGYEVTTHGGRQGTGIDAVQWAREAADRGVGEILLNSIDADGTKAGFDLEMIRAVRAAVKVPLIASGGAGLPEHFPPAVQAGADAVLAASVFHFGPLDAIAQVKKAISDAGFPVR